MFFRCWSGSQTLRTQKSLPHKNHSAWRYSKDIMHWELDCRVIMKSNSPIRWFTYRANMKIVTGVSRFLFSACCAIWEPFINVFASQSLIINDFANYRSRKVKSFASVHCCFAHILPVKHHLSLRSTNALLIFSRVSRALTPSSVYPMLCLRLSWTYGAHAHNQNPLKPEARIHIACPIWHYKPPAE